MRRAAATVLATAALTAGLGLPGAGIALADVGGQETVTYPGQTTPPGAVLPATQNNAVLPATQNNAVLPATQNNTGGRTTTRKPRVVRDTRATLPFTGGELVALVSVGAGAVGAGAALVVATRRRRPQSV